MPWENIGGRAEFITFSLDGSSSYWNPISWFTALRGGRAGTSLHAERGPPLPPPMSARRCPEAPAAPEEAGPVEFRDPVVRHELKRASVWIGLVLAIVGVIVLAQPLLLIFAGIVLAAMLDGGTRLLGRVLPIGRGWRLAIVTLAAVGFVVWTFYFAGTELVAQAERLRETRHPPGRPHPRLGERHGHLFQGGVDVQQLGGQLMGSLGRLGSAVSSALGAVTSAGDDPRHRHLHRGRAAPLPARRRLDAAAATAATASTAPPSGWASPCAG